MNVSEIAVNRRPELRRVGITFPERHHVVAAAKRVLLELGLDCTIDPLGISLPVPRFSATYYLGALERLTGTPGWNEWDNT